MTLEEVQESLVQVNSAISKLIAGKSITRVLIGTGYTRREFVYSETTLQELKDYRRELIELLSTMSSQAPTFRSYATIPLNIHKAVKGGNCNG